MQKFWYVSRDPATVSYHDPKKAFFDKSEAKKFAEKMVRSTGHDFYVMEAIEMVKQATPPIEWNTVETPKKKLKRARNSWGQWTSDWVYDY